MCMKELWKVEELELVEGGEVAIDGDKRREGLAEAWTEGIVLWVDWKEMDKESNLGTYINKTQGRIKTDILRSSIHGEREKI